MSDDNEHHKKKINEFVDKWMEQILGKKLKPILDNKYPKPVKFSIMLINDHITPFPFLKTAIAQTLVKTEEELDKHINDLELTDLTILGSYPIEIAETHSIKLWTLGKKEGYNLIIRIAATSEVLV